MGASHFTIQLSALFYLFIYKPSSESAQ